MSNEKYEGLNNEKYEDYIKKLKVKNPTELTESEIADLLDNEINSPKIRYYFRLLQLQLNLIKSTADIAKMQSMAIIMCMPDDLKKVVLEKVKKMNDELTAMQLQEIKDMERLK